MSIVTVVTVGVAPTSDDLTPNGSVTSSTPGTPALMTSISAATLSSHPGRSSWKDVSRAVFAVVLVRMLWYCL